MKYKFRTNTKSAELAIKVLGKAISDNEVTELLGLTFEDVQYVKVIRTQLIKGLYAHKTSSEGK